MLSLIFLQTYLVTHSPAASHSPSGLNPSQSTGSRLPSRARSTSPTDISEASLASTYPPPAPRTLRISPFFLSKDINCSRYRSERLWRSAILQIGTGSFSLYTAISIIARSPYLPFVESFNSSPSFESLLFY